MFRFIFKYSIKQWLSSIDKACTSRDGKLHKLLMNILMDFKALKYL